MGKTITFVVHGEPRGKARPRFDSRHRRTFTPKGTKEYEKQIRKVYLHAYAGGDDLISPDPLEGPLRMVITAGFRIPKTASKIRKDGMIHGLIFPTKKPDADNIAKIIADALNGIAYKDDAQIVILYVAKHYTQGEPYVHIQLEELLE